MAAAFETDVHRAVVAIAVPSFLVTVVVPLTPVPVSLLLVPSIIRIFPTVIPSVIGFFPASLPFGVAGTPPIREHDFPFFSGTGILFLIGLSGVGFFVIGSNFRFLLIPALAIVILVVSLCKRACSCQNHSG
jgi:hypothetical protein